MNTFKKSIRIMSEVYGLAQEYPIFLGVAPLFCLDVLATRGIHGGVDMTNEEQEPSITPRSSTHEIASQSAKVDSVPYGPDACIINLEESDSRQGGFRQALRDFARSVLTGVAHAENLSQQDTLYDLVFSREQWQGLKNGSLAMFDSQRGLKPILRSRDGRIDSFVEIKRVSPRLGQALVGVAIQKGIEDILVQLERIEKKVEKILQGQHSDRMGELAAGIQLLEAANVTRNPDSRRLLLTQACGTLNSAKCKLFELARREITMLCGDLKSDGVMATLQGFLGEADHEKAEKILCGLHENILGAQQAVAGLFRAYWLLGEDEAACLTIDVFADEVKKLEPFLGKTLPYLVETNSRTKKIKKFWKSVPKEVRLLKEQGTQLLAAPKGPIILSFRGSELQLVPEGEQHG